MPGHDLARGFGLVRADDLGQGQVVASAGGETFYVLSPIPYLAANIDWSVQARPYRDAIMQFLKANIVVEHFLNPPRFQNTLNSYLGSAQKK